MMGQQMRRFGQGIAWTAAAAGAGLVLLSLFRLQGAPVPNILPALADVVLLALFVFSAWGFGIRLLLHSGVRIDDRIESAVVAAGLGTLLFATFVFACAAAGCLSTGLLVLVLIFGAAVGLGPARRAVAGRSVPAAEEKVTRGAILLSVFLAVVAGFAALAALTPPISRDALIHHLAVPKLFLQAGGMIEIPHASFSYYPMNVDMLYLAALTLGSDILAKLMHWSLYLGVLAATFTLARRTCRRVPALIAVLCLATMPVMFQVATWAYVDMGLALYVLLAMIALCRWREGEGPRWLVLCALFAGFAAGIKYQGLFLAVLIGAGVLMAAQKVRPAMSTLRAGAAFALVCALAASPWYARNLLHTGNPLYPNYSSTFGGRVFQPDRPRVSHFEARRILDDKGPADELLVPIRISTDFTLRAVKNLDGPLGPLFLVALPFVLLIRKRPSLVNGLLCMSAAYVLFLWPQGMLKARYLIPVLPLMTVAVGVAVEGGPARLGRPGTIVAVALLTAVLSVHLVLVSGYLRYVAPVDYLSGKVTRDEYLREHIRDFDCFAFINSRLPVDARVFFLYTGNDGYYCERDHLFDTYYLGYTIKGIIRAAADAEAIREAFTSLGVTHLFVNWGYLDKSFSLTLAEDEVARFKTFRAKYMEQLYFNRSVEEGVYAIRTP